MKDNCGSKICGIKCEVESCRHHTADNCCDAGQITVGPHHAENSADTACVTFEQK